VVKSTARIVWHTRTARQLAMWVVIDVYCRLDTATVTDF